MTLNDMGGGGVHEKVTSFQIIPMPIISDLDAYIKSPFEEVYE